MVKDWFSAVDIAEAFDYSQKLSPCTRRKYGAIIVDDVGYQTFATNERVGKCCGPNLCARDNLGVRKAGEHPSVEVGAEIHAEQAALIKWEHDYQRLYHILLVGSDHLGILPKIEQHYPCHVCAMMLKYAGFDYIWLPKGKSDVIPVSISEIIEYHEQLY